VRPRWRWDLEVHWSAQRCGQVARPNRLQTREGTRRTLLERQRHMGRPTFLGKRIVWVLKNMKFAKLITASFFAFTLCVDDE
jgi:hypothetical protein